MDFLNKAFQQIRDLFATMNFGARAIALLLIAVLAVSLYYLFQFQSTGGDVYLLGGREFSQSQLADMEAALADAEITGYSIEGYKLKIPRSKRNEALSAISRAGAMPISASDLDDPSGTPNPFLTKSQEDKQAKLEKQQKFNTMMQQVASLESAVLEYDEQRQGGLDRRLVRTAFVTAKAHGNRGLEPHEIESIISAVTGLLTGIDPTNIIVLDTNTSISHKGRPSDDLNDPRNNSYALMRQFYENDWRRKISEALRSFGMPNVQVNVELDDTTSHVEESRQLNSPVTVNSETEKITSESTRNEPAGRPGVVANTGAANSTASVTNSAPTDSNSETRESNTSRVGGTIIATRRATLVPKRVSVSIGVPESYYRAVWLRNNPPAAGETPKPMTPADLAALESQTKAAIEKRVQPLIVSELTGQNIYEPIVVTTDFEIPVEPVAAPGTSDVMMTWLNDNWQTLGMLALGAFGLVMLRSMVSSAAVVPADRNRPAGEANAGSAGAASEAEDDPTRPKRRFDGTGPSLRDELSELIQDDPDAAVSVLKQWIGDAA